jgi:predicted Rossmann fold nucleotide-binding protein DprA/Smf involved in DNA uptake
MSSEMTDEMTCVKSDISPKETKLLLAMSRLEEGESVSIEIICKITGAQEHEALMLLKQLEIKGWITCLEK